MTDKEFDNAIKEALTSDDVPKELNCSLIKKVQRKNKKVKIYTFTKFAAAAAAVFICVVGVLSVNDSTHAPQTIEEKAMTEDSAASTATFNLRKSLTLSDLFNEGYDFKSVINEKIKEEINALPNADEYRFLGISENVRFSLDSQNALTIIFNEGEITLPAHGEQYFIVGTAENGVLN